MRARSLIASLVVLGACTERATPIDAGTATDPDRDLAALESWETRARATADWEHGTPGQAALGVDPIAVLRVAQDRWLVLLRGVDAMILIGPLGREWARIKTPRAPRGLCEGRDGTVLVVGELSNVVQRYQVVGDAIVKGAGFAVDGAFGFRGVSSAKNGRHEVIYLLEPTLEQVLTTDEHGRTLGSATTGPGGIGVMRAGPLVLAAAAEAHAVWAWPVDARGVPQTERALVLRSDGPVWGFAARVVGADVWLATGLAEDHPLDRTQGSFQFIDSFLRVEVLTPATAKPPSVRRAMEVNLSERNVVLPKALAFTGDRQLFVAGAGSGRLASIRMDDTAFTEVRAIPPGTAAMAMLGRADGVELVLVNPLLDAVVFAREHDNDVRPIAGGPARAPLSRIGEALVFTNLIAPAQQSTDGLSRFTCETCHSEGRGDGRIHSTGRGDVHATTKPLLGLGNNVPLFTRAKDPSLVHMANNEFRVANANTGLDPWFSARPEDAPWLVHFNVTQPLPPRLLRQAMAQFFFDFRPHTNPRVAARLAAPRFTAAEATGAALFSARCARCHAPRLVGNDPATAVPPERWPALVLSLAGPLVWARDGYEKTGIEPYVDENGAKPSSLRRIQNKRPYFTNGSSPTLDDVLVRARFDDARFFHSADDATLSRFSAEEISALRAFLLLL